MKKVNPEIDTCDKFERGHIASTVPSEERRCYACSFNLFATCWYDDRFDATVKRALWDFNNDAKGELLRRLKP